ncbi:hypothetical protein C8T65DRAFT_701977 [Cerioporus squamosus]|nr:hypothetical protein C8T65DRAFT_701977 [Cerioporus squamosus]
MCGSGGSRYQYFGGSEHDTRTGRSRNTVTTSGKISCGRRRPAFYYRGLDSCNTRVVFGCNERVKGDGAKIEALQPRGYLMVGSMVLRGVHGAERFEVGAGQERVLRDGERNFSAMSAQAENPFNSPEDHVESVADSSAGDDNVITAAMVTDSCMLLGRPAELNAEGNMRVEDEGLQPNSFADSRTPWQTGGGGYVQRMEQYLVLVVDDREWFFRLSIWFESTERGIRPSVFVELMNAASEQDLLMRTVMLVLSMELQASLLTALDRVVRTTFGSD